MIRPNRPFGRGSPDMVPKNHQTMRNSFPCHTAAPAGMTGGFGQSTEEPST